MPEFINGLNLSKAFYHEIVDPLLSEGFPGLVYSAARMGPGSDVLGFDTPMSMDHDWGPRLELFVSDEDFAGVADEIRVYLARRLPRRFRGFAVGFTAPDPNDNGTQIMDYDAADKTVNHRGAVHTVRSFFERYLGVDPRRPLEPLDWLLVTEQGLLEVTGGEVFHDGLGELGPAREQLRYYPRDIWLFRLAAQWHRLGQEEPFVGRCGEVGDDLGSRVVAARLVRDLMRLCFLMERKYAPYSKWLGTAFSRLKCHSRMSPLLQQALTADTWQARERAIAEVSSLAGDMHNALRLTPPISTDIRRFHSRPFQIIDADRFSEALLSQIEDAWLKTLVLAGGVDQCCDCTDVTSNAAVARRLRGLYQLP